MSDENDNGAGSSNLLPPVSFEAPAPLVDRGEAIARVQEEGLGSVLIEAVHSYLDDAVASEEVRRLVAEQYYDDRLDLEQVEQLVGPGEAQRLRLLKEDLRDDSSLP